MIRLRMIGILVSVVGLFIFQADGRAERKFDKVVFGCYSEDLAGFEAFAQRAKASGATHIVITAEDLPHSYWQYDAPGDPYPAWVITNIGLLKICTPNALKPYLPQDYADQVMSVIEARCKILRRLGLKGVFKTFEPQMLPEKVFEDHPLWRGPRVDHPIRSRKARFAPCIDNPQVLKLYRESIAQLVRRCPEIEMVSLTTNDSGTGLSWSTGLYSGRSGNTRYKFRSTEDRLNGFFAALKAGAADGGGSLEIDMQWTREPNPQIIARQLDAGMAIENLEGPNATPYKATMGFLLDYFNVYYPAVGIPHVAAFLEELERSQRTEAPRLFVLIGDRFNQDLYFQMYDEFLSNPTHDDLTRIQFLRKIAAQRAGEENGADLAAVWQELGEAEELIQLLNTGGYIFYLGSVQQRWLTRPFVPFPEELPAEERDYFRTFQFQGRTEEHANDLFDLQGERLYAGQGGALMVKRLLGEIRSHVAAARKHLANVIKNVAEEEKGRYTLLDDRLRAFICLANNAENAVTYQAQIDRIKSLEHTPHFRPRRGPWDRDMILETARAEIDNTAELMQIIRSSDEVLLHTASPRERADIRVLEPELLDSLQKKLNIMNAKWLDYDRLFSIDWLE